MSLLEPPQDIVKLLRESFDASVIGSTQTTAAPGGGAGGDVNEEIVSYVAFLAAGLAQNHEFNPETWKNELMPYLEELADGSVSADDLETFRAAVEKETLGEDDNDSYGDEDDDGFEEVCNIRFKYVVHVKRIFGKSIEVMSSSSISMCFVFVNNTKENHSLFCVCTSSSSLRYSNFYPTMILS